MHRSKRQLFLPLALAASIAVPSLATGAEARPPLQPGAGAINRSTGLKCTVGFILRGDDGSRYAIVGHTCAPTPRRDVSFGVDQPDVERTWAVGKGPLVHDTTNRAIGRLVYDFVGHHLDVALVRLDAATPYTPRVLEFGGPSRVNTDLDPAPQTVFIYGITPNRATGAQGYQDVLPQGLNARDVVNAAQPSDAYNSGAPVLIGDGNAALGVMGQSAFNVGGNSSPAGGGPVVYRLAPLLAKFQAKLHVKLTLVRSGER